MFKTLLSSTALAATLSAVVWFMPYSAQAFTAELVSILPEAEDISDQIGGGEGEGAPEEVQLFGWTTEVGTEYTATFTVDEEPAMIVTPGGDIALASQPSYNAETGEYVVVFTATGVKGDFGGPPSDEDQPEDEQPQAVQADGQSMTMMGMVGAVEDGENGPPAAMRKGWMSTDIQEWTIKPPSPENVAFGFELNGPEGETGFLHMFIPDTLIDLLGEYSGQELAVEDLAVFNGDNQASLAVTEVEGGAYIDINVVFVQSATAVISAEDSGGYVKKEISVAEQLPVSLAAAKTTVTKGSTVKLYGWLANGKSDQTVTLWRKLKNEDTYVKVKTLKTKKDGSFRERVVVKQTANYKVKYKSGGKTVTSTVTTVTVD